ncbi:MAG: transketolase family protein [Christensenellaceae bacterium]|jgi:transketolase
MADYKVCKTIETEKHAMRDTFGEVITDLAGKNKNVIYMDADLMNSLGMVPFQEKFPEQTINAGIQEANMVGVAAGLSSMGKIPYAHTFACFATRRVADQIFVSCAFAKANVRIIGSDPGVTAAFNGATHMPFEDIGIMRVIPEMTIIEPTDSVMLADILRQTEKLYGNFYIRLSRKNAEKIYEDGAKFDIGKAALLRDGKDATIIASGIMVAEALRAADELAKENISVRVLNIFTIKPIDADAITAAAKETGAIVTAENHNYLNGLGSAVAEVVGETCPVPVKRIGIKDHFGEVGPVDFLKEKFGLTAKDIVSAVKAAVAAKK